MLREDVLREMLARLGRGDGIKRIARELGVDRKTVKAWRVRGAWRARPPVARRRGLDAFRSLLAQRAPAVGWDGRVLHRELQGRGFTGGYFQVQRALQPVRAARSGRRWPVCGSSGAGRADPSRLRPLRLWVADTETVVHLFVFTLGYSRRPWTRAYPHERRTWFSTGTSTSAPFATLAA